jgi:hypothetical protein
VVSGFGLWATLVLGWVQVGGEAQCPSPDQVAAGLRQLGTPTQGEGEPLRATVLKSAGGVRVQLASAGGVRADKVLTGGGGCEQLAKAAAVVLASWASELERELSAQLPQDAPPGPDLPGAELPAPQPISGGQVDVAFDVGAGISAAVGAAGLAVGAQLSGSLTPGLVGLGGQLSFSALGTRPLPAQTGRWERFALGAGPQYRFGLGALNLDAALHGLAAVRSELADEVGGRSQASFEPGAGVGLRLAGPNGLWVGVQATTWVPQAQGAGGPRPAEVEGVVSAGLLWGRP